MFENEVIEMLLEGIRDTVYMTLVSTFIGYLLGLPMGIALAVTDKGNKINVDMRRLLVHIQVA